MVTVHSMAQTTQYNLRADNRLAHAAQLKQDVKDKQALELAARRLSSLADTDPRSPAHPWSTAVEGCW